MELPPGHHLQVHQVTDKKNYLLIHCHTRGEHLQSANMLAFLTPFGALKRFCFAFKSACRETTLTGESRFHLSTPLGNEPGSLMTRSKQVDHWTNGTVYEYSGIAGSPQGSPLQPTMSVVKPERGSATSVKPGHKSCVRSSGIITLSARWPNYVSGQSPPQMRPQ